ncbi:hypothetical protein [Haloparvum sedimenti]|uniref:hypothetical protein n=1 Tax=Haloparvum sedimenti TaxID=1678448 RepID=UPI000F77A0C0|nr:hypothetical protein [Haloparvum sedimenti]
MNGGGAGFGTGTYADRGQLTAVAVRGRGDEEATANRGRRVARGRAPRDREVMAVGSRSGHDLDPDVNESV